MKINRKFKGLFYTAVGFGSLFALTSAQALIILPGPIGIPIFIP